MLSYIESVRPLTEQKSGGTAGGDGGGGGGSGSGKPSSRTNYWSDGVFESSGASTPRGERVSAHRRLSPEGLVHPPQAGDSCISPAHHANHRAHSLRKIRESVTSTSRGSNFRGSGKKKLVDINGTGFSSSHKPVAIRGDYLSTGTTVTIVGPPGDGGGGRGTGPGRFAGKKIEAKGLRRRARAIRGALLRRGASEKNKASEASAASAAIAGVGAVAVRENAVTGKGAGREGNGIKSTVVVAVVGKHGGSGRKQNVQLKLPGDQGAHVTVAAMPRVEGGGQDGNRKRPQLSSGRASGLITGAVTPWDAVNNPGERLTSSSSFSADEDSEPESTAHQRDGGSNGPNVFNSITVSGR